MTRTRTRSRYCDHYSPRQDTSTSSASGRIRRYASPLPRRLIVPLLPKPVAAVPPSPRSSTDSSASTQHSKLATSSAGTPSSPQSQSQLPLAGDGLCPCLKQCSTIMHQFRGLEFKVPFTDHDLLHRIEQLSCTWAQREALVAALRQNEAAFIELFIALSTTLADIVDTEGQGIGAVFRSQADVERSSSFLSWVNSPIISYVLGILSARPGKMVMNGVDPLESAVVKLKERMGRQTQISNSSTTVSSLIHSSSV